MKITAVLIRDDFSSYYFELKTHSLLKRVPVGEHDEPITLYITDFLYCLDDSFPSLTPSWVLSLKLVSLAAMWNHRLINQPWLHQWERFWMWARDMIRGTVGKTHGASGGETLGRVVLRWSWLCLRLETHPMTYPGYPQILPWAHGPYCQLQEAHDRLQGAFCIMSLMLAEGPWGKQDLCRPAAARALCRPKGPSDWHTMVLRPLMSLLYWLNIIIIKHHSERASVGLRCPSVTQPEMALSGPKIALRWTWRNPYRPK